MPALKERNISHGYIRVTARKVIKRPTTDGYIASAGNIAEKSSITESVVPSTTGIAVERLEADWLYYRPLPTGIAVERLEADGCIVAAIDIAKERIPAGRPC